MLSRYLKPPTLSTSSYASQTIRLSRHYSSNHEANDDALPLMRIPRAHVFHFGQGNATRPVFSTLEWTMKDSGREAWAVVGAGSGRKTALLETLRGNLRITPAPPGGLYPALSARNIDPYGAVTLVSFAHRARSAGSDFVDYSARYGAVRDEDRVTLREMLFNSIQNMNEEYKRTFEGLVDALALRKQLDLPVIALSNGQTRKARILSALLLRPEVLLLDEPLTGLDAPTRDTVLGLLKDVHQARSPRVVLGLRVQDPVPSWVTHLAVVDPGPGVWLGRVEQWAETPPRATAASNNQLKARAEPVGPPVLEMKNVNVAYQGRKVLKNIDWTIRAGERWHLRGANGSGKTTLLSLLTGDHPQSYTQRGESSLSLFGCPRHKIATPSLQARVALVSPELTNAFPRRERTTVWDVVGTGFGGGFVPRDPCEGVSVEEGSLRKARMWEVLRALGPAAWQDDPAAAVAAVEVHEADSRDALTRTFAAREFVGLSGGEQSVAFLARALVARAPLVLLDEVWSGMDERMVRAARAFVRTERGVGPEQAVVVISHWEEEVPWKQVEGVRRLTLEDGVAHVEN